MARTSRESGRQGSRQEREPDAGRARELAEKLSRRGLMARGPATFRRQLIQCGKPRCKKWHGPYWYAFWHRGQKTHSLYVGSGRMLAEVLGAMGDEDPSSHVAYLERSTKVVRTVKRVRA